MKRGSLGLGADKYYLPIIDVATLAVIVECQVLIFWTVFSWCLFRLGIHRSTMTETDPLSEVKVGQIGQWLSRRNYGPQAMASAISRSYWRWMQKYMLVRKTGVAPFVQAAMCMSTFFYFFQYRSHAAHRHAKYH